MKSGARLFNPLAMPLAASGLIPVWGVIRHRGRKSGRSFSTPIAVGATREHFFVPLPWGDKTDWCRNVIAAGGAVIRYRGRDAAASDPIVVSSAEALIAYPAAVRPLIGAFGIQRFLRLRRGDAARRAA